ncbi:MAG: hypothetical protein GY718_12825 [Lentisphaerae bacterium]|nr:hypothetical protein [Lentisphaerota bacterium]
MDIIVLVYDYLQDDFDMAMLCAKEEFKLNQDWQEVSDKSYVNSNLRFQKQLINYGVKRQEEN